MRINRNNWKKSADKLQKIYFKYPDNCKTFTSIKYMKDVTRDVSHIFILTKI